MKKVCGVMLDLFFLTLAFIMVFPFLYMLVVSFQETYSPYLLSFDPADYSLDNYFLLFQRSGFFLWVRNSFLVSISGVLLTLAICSTAGYAFAKLRFPGNDRIFFFLFAAMAIPFPATVVPLWIIMGKVGIASTMASLILPVPTFLGVILFRQAFLSIPGDMIESAKIDGCTDFQTFAAVVLPLVRSTVMSVAIIYFARSWNSLLWPMIMAGGDYNRTLPVGLAAMQDLYVVNYGLSMAGAVINFLPPFIVYLLLQKYFIQGVVSSGLKA
ncbi:carbohydrate ABC transporter permease [Bacilliculturomica massiliensis]|uniref:carbohydrate ABC transporter permease n=1 Tax=Bacilliculturomica massiliensis TaxID=1917867 RepID=UPI00103156F1|nr:carbohydrate ABC transporter permease [Bacilliculturomica massiliensis]